MIYMGFYGVGKTTCQNDKMVDLTDLGQPSLSILLDAVAKYPIVMCDPQYEFVVLESGLPFIVVIPTPDRKEEFLANYRERYKKGTGGGDDKFCSIIDKNWYDWLDYSRKLPAYATIQLEKGEWMIDAIKAIQGHTK